MAASKIDRSDKRWSVMVPYLTRGKAATFRKSMRNPAAQPATYFFGRAQTASVLGVALTQPIEFAPQPGASVGPVAVGRALRQAEAPCRLRQRQAGEDAQLDQAGDQRFLACESGQRRIDGQQVAASLIDGQLSLQQVVPLPAPAVLLGLFASGLIDENAAHGLGGGGEEVAAAVPVLRRFGAHQAQVGLVDQGGGLEGLAGRFLGHLPGRQPA